MQGSQCFLCFQEIALDSNQGLYLDLRHLVHHHSLESLSLSNTELVSIDGINRAQNLKQIFAVGNQCMNGTLTEEISTLVQLEKLYLADNSLTGELPTDLFYMPNLEELDLSRNKFHGTIPHTIGSSPKLKTLFLPMNYLTGSLPSEISTVTTLEKLDLQHQLGSRPIEGRLPDFANATNLHFIDISYNAISRDLPENLLVSSQIPQSEIIIDLSNNDITGTIPASLSRLSKLDLRLPNNLIEGIPKELCTQSEW